MINKLELGDLIIFNHETYHVNKLCFVISDSDKYVNLLWLNYFDHPHNVECVSKYTFINDNRYLIIKAKSNEKL